MSEPFAFLAFERDGPSRTAEGGSARESHSNTDSLIFVSQMYLTSTLGGSADA